MANLAQDKDPSADETEAARQSVRAEAKNAGRGFLFIVSAKIFFIITSYAVQLTLPRLLGEVDFGLYATAMRVVSMINNVLIVATVQSVSRFVSEKDGQTDGVVRYALRIQLLIAIALGGLLLAAAPLLSSSLLDDRLTVLFRIVSIVPFSYALYATFVGWFNGTQRFKHQASLDMAFSALRTAAIIGAALLGLKAIGAISGFAVASLVILTIAASLAGLPKSGTGYEGHASTWLKFMAPLFLYHAALNAMMQIDQPLLKRSATLIASTEGLDPAAAADTASRFAGYYQAAQTFAFVPYQFILSITFIIFPLISKAVAEGNKERARSYIQNSLRISFLFLLAVSAPISAAAEGVIRVAYPETFAISAAPLQVLVFGLAAFAMFVISATIVTSAGSPGRASSAAIIGVLLVVGLNLWLVPQSELGPSTLNRAALATSVGMASAWLASVAFVWNRFSTYLPLGTWLRGAAGAIAAWFCSDWLAGTTFMQTLVAGFVGVFVFVLVLILTGELNRQELARIRSVFRRNKTAP